MTPITITSRRLPGIQGFLKKSPIFRNVKRNSHPSRPELIEAAVTAVRTGEYRPGDRFPTPGEIADLTGASLIDSLDAVSSLLRLHVIHQTSSGRLLISAKKR
jgi:hypothetical protein